MESFKGINWDTTIENVTLKNFCNLDQAGIEKVRRWRNSDEVKKFMFTQDEIKQEQQLAFIEKLRTNSSKGYWLVYHKQDPVGSVYVYNVDNVMKQCYWGYYMDPSLIGASYGILLEYVVAQLVFGQMHLHMLLCEGFVRNTAAIKIHKEFGFRELSSDGNVLTMGLTKDDWLSKKPFVELMISRFFE